MDSGHAAVISARQHFNVVLDDVLTRASEDARQGHEESDEVAKSTAMELLQLPNRTPEASQVTKRATGRSPRKRPRTRDDGKTQSDETYHVMKLFDRSVDLAQFNTETPLYVVCRAWMKNLQPDQHDRNYDTAGLDLLTCATLGGEPVFSLPSSAPSPGTSGGTPQAADALAIKGRVDHVLYSQEQQQQEQQAYGLVEGDGGAPPSDALISANLQHWRGLREHRRRHAADGARRHQESFKTLKELKEPDIS